MTMRSDKWILRNFNNHVKYNIIDSGARFRTKFSGLEKDKDQFEILGSSLPTFFYGRPPTEEDYKRQRDIINRALLPLHGTNPESSIMFNECSISIAADSAHAMISPFHGESVKYLPDGRKIPSYGLSSYGYDIRLGRHFKVFRRDDSTLEEIDLLGFKEAVLVNDHKDVDDFVLYPGDFALGVSMEHIEMPADHVCICMAKSTLARMGLHVCVTPLEPGWKGYVTLEIFNMTSLPIRVYSGIGVMQAMWAEGDEPCAVSYATRGGKYQNQANEPIVPRM
jgi:dCTP deaminase